MLERGTVVLGDSPPIQTCEVSSMTQFAQSSPPADNRIHRFARRLRGLSPGTNAWRGAALGVLIITLLVPLVSFGALAAHAGVGIIAAVAAAGMLLVLALASILYAVGWLLGKTTRLYRWALLAAAGSAGLLAILTMPMLPGSLGLLAALLIGASLAGAGLAVVLRGSLPKLTRGQRVLFYAGSLGGALLLLAVGVFLAWQGATARPPLNAAGVNADQIAPLDLPNPSLPGAYPVATLTYGSGSDLRRPEFGAHAALITPPVDGSRLVTGWSPLRSAYWGFSPEAMPLNGRVWYPKGEGHFPLIIIAHGNHPMEHYSDNGYAYLGELLASRGYIVAAVDENFLNLSAWGDLLFFQRLEQESDARGWLLLEHLRLWRAWNEQPGNPFHRRVDLDRIALIGHSRGGEAVTIAAAFNRLVHYPDDAALTFDYGFNIRSLVAIAPAEGQYQPSGVATPLVDVNYLLLHGAHDMDVVTLMGSAPFERLRFTGEDYYFKSAYYIYAANHGQFNRDWGSKDLAEPVARLFNLRQLLPARDQERIAAVLISAYLDCTLRGETGYLPLFQDARRGRHWLPDTLYLTRFADSHTRLLTDYAADIDLTSAALPGATLEGSHLTIWREAVVRGKWGDFGFKGAYLGWDSQMQPGAAYTLHLPPSGLSVSPESVLNLSLADANQPPLPDHPRSIPQLGAERPPIDLTIEVFDRHGNLARLPLSRYALLQPQIEGVFTKSAVMLAIPRSEPVFQSFEFPLVWFREANPALNVDALAGVRLVFDRTPAGVIIVNAVGLR